MTLLSIIFYSLQSNSVDFSLIQLLMLYVIVRYHNLSLLSSWLTKEWVSRIIPSFQGSVLIVKQKAVHEHNVNIIHIVYEHNILCFLAYFTVYVHNKEK